MSSDSEVADRVAYRHRKEAEKQGITITQQEAKKQIIKHLERHDRQRDQGDRNGK